MNQTRWDHDSVPRHLAQAYADEDWATLVDYWDKFLTPIKAEDFTPGHPLFTSAYILMAWIDDLALRTLMTEAQVAATQQRLAEALAEVSAPMVA